MALLIPATIHHVNRFALHLYQPHVLVLVSRISFCKKITQLVHVSVLIFVLKLPALDSVQDNITGVCSDLG